MKTLLTFPKLSVRRLATIGILLALSYLVGRLSITIIPKQLVLSFTFILESIIGSITGPLLGFLTLGVFDLIDTLFSEKAGMFLIGWTIMEAIMGFLYGAFFYGKSFSWSSKKDWIYVSLAMTVITILGSFIMTPWLIQHYYHVPIMAQFVAGRWIKIVEIPIRILVTMTVFPQLNRIPEYRKLLNPQN
ncbi:folate family ECF transporter S component [Streptococcus jiangjianxini]|uniref:folate family ECF transporter S component n=1 Tax=Streptococcus jiangjianxini TaxID=3161189 RepID=UPI0032EF49A7